MLFRSALFCFLAGQNSPPLTVSFSILQYLPSFLYRNINFSFPKPTLHFSFVSRHPPRRKLNRIGPEADLREIEYLSAIHQSDARSLRPDGTISSDDVRVYLRSRYGLNIPREEAAQIVRGLGGTAKAEAEATDHPNDGDDVVDIEKNHSSSLASSMDVDDDTKHGVVLDDDEYLDLVQFVAILFIPTLQRAKRQVDIDKGLVKIAPIPALPDTNWRLIFTQRKQYQANKMLAKQLTQEREEREFHDSLEPSQSEDGNCIYMVLQVLFEAIGEKSGTRTPAGRHLDMLPHVILSHDLVIKILEAFGFGDLATNDELVDEMVQAAGGAGGVFDELAFAKALTSDVTLRETGIEDKTSETFEDVYGFDMSKLQYASKKVVDRRQMKKDGKLATFLVKQHGEDSSSTGSNRQDRLVQEESVVSTTNEVPAPVHSKNGGSNAPSTAGDEGWVSFDNEEGQVVDWSSAKAVDLSVALNGEIEIAESEPPKEPSQIARLEGDLYEVEDDDVSVELKKPIYISTAPAIDYVSDEYKSIAYLCGTWVYFIFGAAAFMSLLALVDLQIFKCSDGFFCTLVQKVWSWLVFGLMLSFGGLIVVAPLRYVSKSCSIYVFSHVAQSLRYFHPSCSMLDNISSMSCLSTVLAMTPTEKVCSERSFRWFGPSSLVQSPFFSSRRTPAAFLTHPTGF